MTRKRLTQMFPWLLPLRQKQRKLFFYLQMKLDRNTYAKKRQPKPLPYLIAEDEAQMINRNSGFPLKYQYNKVHNLKLAAKEADGLLLRPGETFSFWQTIRHADRKEPYLDGLCLVDGKIRGEYGGGLCQLSNLLYWLFLHTPLTVTERHGHETEAIPQPEGTLAGIDATVAEGWLDLKVKNETALTYRIGVCFDGEKLCAKITSDGPKTFDYRPYNAKVEYIRENGEIYEESRLCREKTNCSTGETEEEFLYDNRCRISYPLPEGVVSKERG